VIWRQKYILSFFELRSNIPLQKQQNALVASDFVHLLFYIFFRMPLRSSSIPVPEAKKGSSSSAPALVRRKRHLAGSDDLNMSDGFDNELKDSHVNSKQVQLKKTSTAQGESTSTNSGTDMDSSLGILSPSDMKSGLPSMSASMASNQGSSGWTGEPVLTRSRTFTRELNDPQAEEDVTIEDLDVTLKSEDVQQPVPTKRRQVKKFKLNTNQIENVQDDNTNLLMSRTDRLLKSKKSPSSVIKVPKKIIVSSSMMNDDAAAAAAADNYPDVTDTLKSRTEALLHSRSRTKKKKSQPKQVVKSMPPIEVIENFDSGSGSSWSNIPHGLKDAVITASVLSSDAGISSMPSSMISNGDDESLRYIISSSPAMMMMAVRKDHQPVSLPVNLLSSPPDVVEPSSRARSVTCAY
jgi:hypothetical protein